MVSRAILLMLMVAAFMGISLLLMIGNQLNLSANDYSHFFNFCLVTFLMFLVFFILGTITSTMKSKVVGLMTMTIIWFVLVFFIPAAVHAVISDRAESLTPIYKNELSQFRILLDWEQRAIQKGGIVKKEEKMPQEEREGIERFWNNEFKNIMNIESQIQSEMKNNIEVYHNLSIFFPSTFYFSTTNEISSKGYDNLIDFYKNAQEVKRNFFRYYINQIYYYSNYSKVESFIKGDENMFYARSRLPSNFKLGIWIMVFYLGMLSWWSYKRYKRAVFGFTEDWRGGLKNPRLFLDKGELRPFYIEDERFGHQIYNLLSGENQQFKDHGFQDKIYVEDNDIVLQPRKDEFLYLSHLSSIPGDITAGALVKLIVRILGARKKRKGESGKIPIVPPGSLSFNYAKKSISQLERQEQEHLLLALLRHETRPIYLINDIGKGLSISFVLQLKKQMELLANDGALVIYLTTDYHPPVRTLRKEETFFNHTKWQDVVGSLEGLAGDELEQDKEVKE
jgi:ABC-type transport system involved in multi-copper enzyme maturation permease subunit